MRANRSLYLADGDHDGRHVVPGDAYRAWGDRDMEWICWANTMYRLHLGRGW